jgi:predicted MFS family arabinose efflux permease
MTAAQMDGSEVADTGGPCTEGQRGVPAHRTRNMSLLTTAQTLYLCGISIDLTLTGLVGLQLAPRPALATLPFALISVGSGLVTFPASKFMGRYGRRAGFLLGSTAAAVGGLISVMAIYLHTFVLFCLGVGCIGIYHAIAGYYRYAAADISPPGQRGRAISTVLSGGVLAAIAGPFLATATRNVLSAPFAGSYGFVTVLAVISMAVQSRLTLDAAAQPKAAACSAPTAENTTRTLGQIARQPTFIAGVAGCAIGYFTMISAMTAAPIAEIMERRTVSQGASIIQGHMVGMYATVFVSGRLVQRIGATWTLTIGTFVTSAAAVIATTGTSQVHFMVALTLFGIGWNLMYVSGSALLASSYRPLERTVVQGVGEVCTLGGSAVGALSAGSVLNLVGWTTMVALLLGPLCLALLAALWHFAASRRARAVRPPETDQLANSLRASRS